MTQKFLDLADRDGMAKLFEEYPFERVIHLAAQAYADIDALQSAVVFTPSTPIELGIERTLGWYQEYRKANNALKIDMDYRRNRMSK